MRFTSTLVNCCIQSQLDLIDPSYKHNRNDIIKKAVEIN
jgi:hypothetical protein